GRAWIFRVAAREETGKHRRAVVLLVLPQQPAKQAASLVHLRQGGIVVHQAEGQFEMLRGDSEPFAQLLADRFNLAFFCLPTFGFCQRLLRTRERADGFLACLYRLVESLWSPFGVGSASQFFQQLLGLLLVHAWQKRQVGIVVARLAKQLFAG